MIPRHRDTGNWKHQETPGDIHKHGRNLRELLWQPQSSKPGLSLSAAPGVSKLLPPLDSGHGACPCCLVVGLLPAPGPPPSLEVPGLGLSLDVASAHTLVFRSPADQVCLAGRPWTLCTHPIQQLLERIRTPPARMGESEPCSVQIKPGPNSWGVKLISELHCRPSVLPR